MLTAKSRQDLPVLIVGSGLAGLSLAHGLKTGNIPFRIFERDDSASFRAQGYRIRITPYGASALQKLLPGPHWKAFEATCAAYVPDGHFVDALTGDQQKWQMAGPSSSVYNVDRTVCRKLLLEGLEEYVEFGKRHERYEVTDAGEVRVCFSDGTNATGCLLVGADGIRSPVRYQLLPDFRLLDTEGRAIFGKTSITDELIEQIPAEMLQGLTLAGKGQESRMKLFCDAMNFNRLVADGDSTMGVDIPPWVLIFRLDELSPSDQATLLSLSAAESAQKAESLISTWHPSLRALLAAQTVSETSTLSVLSADPDQVSGPWNTATSAAGRVTLIGDAAHPMAPVGGVGANAALQDAADLCEALCSGRERWKERITAFEQKMLGRARAVVERSAAGGGRMFGMRPFGELKAAVLEKPG